MTEEEFANLLYEHTLLSDDFYGYSCSGSLPGCGSVWGVDSYARHVYSLM